jgi:hypothetical protein
MHEVAADAGEVVFIDFGTDGRNLSDLVSQGIGIVSPLRGATGLALRRLDLEGLSKFFGWDQRPGVSFVTGLSAALATGRRGRWSPFDVHGRRVCRRRLRRVGGVLLEQRLQVSDALLQRGDDSQYGRLGFRRDPHERLPLNEYFSLH